MTLDGKPMSLTASGPVAWEPGHVAPQSFKSQASTSLEIAAAGDFEKDQPFTAAVWVNLAQETETGALVARMDNEHGHRGWDLWVDKGKIASHIISDWDSDAIRANTNTSIKPGEWNHILLRYDGSGKAAGIKIYFNGAAATDGPGRRPAEEFDPHHGPTEDRPTAVGRSRSTAP